MSAEKKQTDQLERFKHVAKELECDESEDALEKAFSGLDPKLKKKGADKQAPESKPTRK